MAKKKSPDVTASKLMRAADAVVEFRKNDPPPPSPSGIFSFKLVPVALLVPLGFAVLWGYDFYKEATVDRWKRSAAIEMHRKRDAVFHDWWHEVKKAYEDKKPLPDFPRNLPDGE